MIRTSLAVGMAASLLASGAFAQVTSWRPTHAAGDPAVSLEIPTAAVQKSSQDLTKGTLMAFFTTISEEDLACFLYRTEYSPQADRALWARGLASDKSTLLCRDSDPAISAFNSMGAQSMKIQGSPASVCQANYVKADQAKPAVVISSLTVAGPTAVYKLLCKLSAVDTITVEAAWGSDEEDIGHIQASLRLPKK